MSNVRRSLQLGFQSNWIITEEQLRNETPSRYDGITYEEELALRIAACDRVDKIRNTRPKNATGAAREFMRVQVVVTAKVLLQRFYTQHSFRTHPWEDVALAALFLAAKVEDRPIKVVAILNKYFLSADPEHQDYVERSKDEEYLEMKSRVLKYERIILHTLSFNVTYSSSHQNSALRTVVRRTASQTEWKMVEKISKTFLNDSFQTVASLLFPPEPIAGAMVYLALRMKGYKPSVQDVASSANDAWMTKFGATKAQVVFISQQMLSMYDAKMRSVGKSSSPQMVAFLKNVEEGLASIASPSSSLSAEGEGGGGGGGGGEKVGRGDKANGDTSQAKRSRLEQPPR